MSIELMAIEKGMSLEFAPDDMPIVRQRLVARYGAYGVEPGIDYAVLDVDGECLLFMDEWDAPCLIAETSRGIEMLRSIAADNDPAISARG